MNPVVSVVIPTYNRAHLLPRALESVLTQTFADYELLVVDDGSTDRTAEVMAGYADPRIRYLRQARNRGVSAARNLAMREARGEYIAFLDSDDEWLPEKLARQVALFRTLPAQVGLLYAGSYTVDDSGSMRVDVPRWRGDVFTQLLRVNVIHMSGTVVLRRAVVEAVGGFDEGIPAIEDYDYWLRIAQRYAVEFIPEPLVRYHNPRRIPRKSLAKDENLAARDWFYRKHREEMRRHGVAHLFLLESARRHISTDHWDAKGARRLIRQALRENPTFMTAYSLYLRAVVPRSLRPFLRALRATLGRSRCGARRLLLNAR